VFSVQMEDNAGEMHNVDLSFKYQCAVSTSKSVSH